MRENCICLTVKKSLAKLVREGVIRMSVYRRAFYRLQEMFGRGGARGGDRPAPTLTRAAF